MPALLTHDFFGHDVLARVTGSFFDRANDADFSHELRESFLIGNQGPDPLFYVQSTPRFMKCKKFGSLMHAQKVDETLDALRRIAFSEFEPKQSLLLAYTLGFLCHYTLDSMMHPFVFSQQYAICDAGAKGLDRRDGAAVHAQIEADLDMMLLFQRQGRSIRDYDYTKDVLKVDSATLELLDSAYQALAHEVYDIDLPVDVFSRGVRDMRVSVRFLYSPRGIKRSVIGFAERLFQRHSFLQAMSPCSDITESCVFDNHERQPWTDPSSGAVSTDSFADRYAAALDAALANINHLLAHHPVSEITHGLNFEGCGKVQ